MPAQHRPDVIDTPLVYRTYAVVVGLGGLALAIWGKSAVVQILGSVAIAAGCFAAALAMIEDLESRRRSLLWFTAAHLVVGCTVLLQGKTAWGSGTADWVAAILLNISLLLGCYWATYWNVIEGKPFAFQTLSLFGGDSHLARSVRSRYERQIRQAAAQEERNRLARDLHDSIKQQVFVIQTAAATAQTRFESDPNGAKQALEQVRGSARDAMSEMEAMLDQLRAEPLENAGLVAALKKQCEALGFRTGARVEFNLGTLPPSTALTPGAQEAIFRVAQEALANIGRHARAGSVVVSLDSVSHRVWLRVRDDGAGFDPNLPANGMGMTNMRARAGEFGGEFELWSRPGGGTSIQFSIPCSVIKPTNFRRQTIILGAAVAVFSAVLFVKGVNTGVIPGLALLAIGFAHNLTAWLKTRRADR
jgi:signal transduction histidine kinase